jgi:hypothetical protein
MEGLVVGAALVEVFGAHPGGVLGELDVGHEAIFVPDALRAIEGKTTIEDVGFEGVVDGAETGDEGPEAVQVGGFLFGIVLPIDAVGGAETGHVINDEILIVEDGGADFEKVVELGEEELRVDGEGEVVAAEAGVEVFVNERDEVGEVGAVEAGEEMVEAFFGERGGVKPGEGGRFEAFERVGVDGQGTGLEGVTTDEVRVEGGGDGTLLVESFALVGVGEVETLAEEFEGFLVVGVVGEESLAVFELADAGVVAVGVAGDPLVDHLLGLGEVVGVLGVESVVVVVIGGAGDELFEGDGAIGGEGEFLFEAEGAGEGGGSEGRENGGGEETGGRTVGRGTRHGELLHL